MKISYIMKATPGHKLQYETSYNTKQNDLYLFSYCKIALICTLYDASSGTLHLNIAKKKRGKKEQQTTNADKNNYKYDDRWA